MTFFQLGKLENIWLYQMPFFNKFDFSKKKAQNTFLKNDIIDENGGKNAGTHKKGKIIF